MLTHSETLDQMEQAHQMKMQVQKQMEDWLLEAGIHPNLKSAGVTYRRCGYPPFSLGAWFCISGKDAGIDISWSSAGLLNNPNLRVEGPASLVEAEAKLDRISVLMHNLLLWVEGWCSHTEVSHG